MHLYLCEPGIIHWRVDRAGLGICFVLGDQGEEMTHWVPNAMQRQATCIAAAVLKQKEEQVLTTGCESSVGLKTNQCVRLQLDGDQGSKEEMNLINGRGPASTSRMQVRVLSLILRMTSTVHQKWGVTVTECCFSITILAECTIGHCKVIPRSLKSLATWSWWLKWRCQHIERAGLDFSSLVDFERNEGKKDKMWPAGVWAEHLVE